MEAGEQRDTVCDYPRPRRVLKQKADTGETGSRDTRADQGVLALWDRSRGCSSVWTRETTGVSRSVRLISNMADSQTLQEWYPSGESATTTSPDIKRQRKFRCTSLYISNCTACVISKHRQ